MNCRDVQKYIDDMLLRETGEAMPPDVADHLSVCASCARQYELATQTLASVQLSQQVHASSNLKERIMSRVMEIQMTAAKPIAAKTWQVRTWKPLYALAMAAALLAVASLYHWFGPHHGAPANLKAFGLLSQARAAEDELFARAGIAHVVNEIVVKPVSNPDLARIRWLPIVSLDVDGKPHFNQLTLSGLAGSAKSSEGFIVTDEIWYESKTGRFVRLMAVEGKAIFANAFDGTALYALETAADGTARVTAKAVAADFRAPKSPAEFLGMTAGFPSALNEKDPTQVLKTEEITLSDGAQGRVVKLGFPGGPPAAADSYMSFTIRKSANTLAEIEWVAYGESLLVIRRAKTETVEKPAIAWNLEGIEKMAGAAPAPQKVAITPDMVLQDVAVKQMVAKADFETYVFAASPSWAGERRITDILDIASPPHRMFAITYRAADGRHVVLIQSYTYNTMLGPKVKTGKVVYESPKGFKVWSGPLDKWLAGILLNSARATIKDAPSENRTGYIIETPAGTFPALAINGSVSDEELHALVDSLIPAKGQTEK